MTVQSMNKWGVIWRHFSFAPIANLYGLYQYAFGAKGVVRERVVGQKAARRLSRADTAFLWTHHAIWRVPVRYE